MGRKWYDAIEEVILVTVLIRSAAVLDWSISYILSGLIAVLNLPGLFPVDELRFFESCRIRASSGFCVCSLILHLLVAATVGSDVMQTGYSTGNGHLQLGMAIASSLSFCFCQIIYSSLFSGLAIPLPITVTMLTVPCIIGSQIMGAAAAYDWDDVPEISIYSFLILLFVEILQTVFPRSFTAGESFLISAIIIQLIRWIGTEANIQHCESVGLMITAGLSSLIANTSIITCAHLTRKERNSSPKLTRGDCQLAIVFYTVIVMCVVLMPMFSTILGYPPPIQWLFLFLYECVDFNHFLVISFWTFLGYLSYKVIENHTTKNLNREMTTTQRKIFHLFGVLALLGGIWIDLNLVGLVTFALFIIFFWISLYSAYQIYPYGGQARRILTLMTDHRDSGKLVLTPIYLLFGLAVPIWIDLAKYGKATTATYAGISALGFGDSAAAIIGKQFGKYRIFRDGKSVEGLVANFVSQVGFYYFLSVFTEVTLSSSLIFSLYCCAMLEAATDQIDNFILPLFLYSMIGLSP